MRTGPKVIYWYVSANQIGTGVGVDSALLFTQAAFELLAWAHCVLETKAVSAGTFNGRGMSAAEKLRLLVHSLEVPLALPEKARPLHANRGKKWVDFIDAITDLRYGLVHASAKKKVPNGAYYEARKLSQWYIEVALLRLCSYLGRYVNRLSPHRFKKAEALPFASEVHDFRPW